MRHRYYDPVSRRFLSRDPLFDDSLGNLYAPFERNGYSWRDPWGLGKDASHETSNDEGRTLQMPGEAFVNLSNWFARTDAGEGVRRRIDELNQFLDDVERRNVAERGIPGAERRRLQINQSRHNDFVAGQGDREFVAELTVDIGVGFFAAVPTGIYSMISGGYDMHENGLSLENILDFAGGLGEFSALVKYGDEIVDGAGHISKKGDNFNLVGEPKLGFSPERPYIRGSTANPNHPTSPSRLPSNLPEDLAIREAMSNPAAGKSLPFKMTDSRWPASEGWVKKQHIHVTGTGEPITVHYVYNTKNGLIDDFKIKLD